VIRADVCGGCAAWALDERAAKSARKTTVASFTVMM
jgi:hypothetical protein